MAPANVDVDVVHDDVESGSNSRNCGTPPASPSEFGWAGSNKASVTQVRLAALLPVVATSSGGESRGSWCPSERGLGVNL